MLVSVRKKWFRERGKVYGRPWSVCGLREEVEEFCKTAESLPFVLLIQNSIVAQAKVQGESQAQVIARRATLIHVMRTWTTLRYSLTRQTYWYLSLSLEQVIPRSGSSWQFAPASLPPGATEQVPIW